MKLDSEMKRDHEACERQAIDLVNRLKAVL